MGRRWFQQKDIKNRVYLYVFWQSKFIVHFPNLFFNFERSNLFEIQFVTRPLCFDILSEEVYFIPLLKFWCLLVPLIVIHGCLIGDKLNIQA